MPHINKHLPYLDAGPGVKAKETVINGLTLIKCLGVASANASTNCFIAEFTQFSLVFVIKSIERTLQCK